MVLNRHHGNSNSSHNRMNRSTVLQQRTIISSGRSIGNNTNTGNDVVGGSNSSSGGLLSRRKSNDVTVFRHFYHRAHSLGYEVVQQTQIVQPPNPWKVLAGGIMMIGMMILCIGLDFQKPNNVATTIATTATKSKHHQECKYDGHCDVGSTCTVPNEEQILEAESFSSLPGVCEQISIITNNPGDFYLDHLDDDKKDDDDDSCITQCQRELELDEFYYFKSIPNVVQTKKVIYSFGRPVGCNILYSRNYSLTELSILHEQDQIDGSNNPQSKTTLLNDQNVVSLEQWMNQRFKYVIRVDPFQQYDDDDNNNSNDNNNNNNNNNKWMAYCFRPCKSDSDCSTPNDDNHKYPGFICNITGSYCQRNPYYWNDNADDSSNYKENDSTSNKNYNMETNTIISDHQENMVIVSGSTTNHFDSIRRLVASAQLFAPQNNVVIYNIDGKLTKQQITEAKTWNNVITVGWEDGIPDHITSFDNLMHVSKPVIINETLHKYKKIIWFDAGSLLRGPITPIEQIVERTGVFLVKRQDDTDMRLVSHAETYDWFDTSKATFFESNGGGGGHNYAGHIQGYLYPSRYVHSIVIPNAECALDMNCIMPPGSNFGGNFQYDEIPLSVLAGHPKVQVPHHTEYIGSVINPLEEVNPKPTSLRVII